MSGRPRPKTISVITVTFNAAKILRPTLESVLGQTRKPDEYWVIDGGSSDGTVDLIQDFSDRLTGWISESDRGIYDAMNKGVSRAKGDYVLFMNAGDGFPGEDILERVCAELDDPAYLWGDCLVERDGRRFVDVAKQMKTHLHRQMTVSHQSLYVRTDLLRAHPFDIGYRIAADYDLLCWLVTKGYEGCYLPVPLSRILGDGASSRQYFLGLKEKSAISGRYFPRRRFASGLFFLILRVYMGLKMLVKRGKFYRSPGNGA